jgi:hypothetical protein
MASTNDLLRRLGSVNTQLLKSQSSYGIRPYKSHPLGALLLKLATEEAKTEAGFEKKVATAIKGRSKSRMSRGSFGRSGKGAGRVAGAGAVPCECNLR